MLALVLVLGCRPPEADPALATTAHLTTPIPVDPSVLSGVLPNGLTWYTEHQEEPKDRLVLRLVVDAGSILEDEDQRGIAHLVEHMAFNGTTRFPGNGVITYLESIGAAFGPHVNAHTSFDETVYKLMVPTDDPAGVSKALDVLEDWAGGISFETAAIEAEKGVVVEEWRRNQGAGFRVSKAMLPHTYGEAYANRMPIGTDESIQAFEPDAVRRFYRDWYRPELMAVIAVGDVDPAEMAAEIEWRFGDLRGPDAPRARDRVEMPPFPDRRIAIVADPELTQTSVSYGRGFDDREGATHAAARKNAVEGLMLSMVRERLGDRTRAADRPFLSAGVGWSRLSPTESSRQLSARARENGGPAALEALLTEWVRVGRHGFNPGEFSRARSERLAEYDEMLAQKEDRESVGEAEELVRVYTNGEYYTLVEYEVAMMRRFYQEVPLDEVNAFARTWLAGDSVVASLTLPAKPESPPPTESEIAALIDRVLASDPPALADISSDGPLVAVPPTQGSIVATTTLDPGLAFTRWELSNGVEVLFRETPFTADEIVLRGWSPGGTWLASEADWVAASTAVDLAKASGFGPYDAALLEKRLSGRRLSVGPWIGSQFEGFDVTSSREDLDTALSLLWLQATAPRFDPEILERDRLDRANALRQRALNPETPFQDAFTAALWGDHRRYRRWVVEDLVEMDLVRSEAFYRSRFADFSDATFAIVGDVDEATLRPLVERWLGSLPGGGRVEIAPDVGARRALGQHEIEVRSGTEPVARVRILYHGAFDNDVLARNRQQAVADVLRTLLREDLREARSGVYGVSVWTDDDKRVPSPAWELGIEFVCDPARVPELKEAALAIVEKVRTTPVAAHYVADLRAKNRRDREVGLKANDWWVDILAVFFQNEEDPGLILKWDERNDSLSPEVVVEAAGRFLDPANRLVVVRLPK